MALILAIETTTKNCSVALGLDGKLVTIREISTQRYSHAENLHQFIKEVLQKENYNFSALDAIAVSRGPGSYTGLRIGVSAAKGLCFSLDLPLIAVNTLTSLAFQVDVTKTKTDFIIPVLDARRREVYTSTLNHKKENLSKVEAKILNENSFEEYTKKGNVIFIGNAVKKVKDTIQYQTADYIESLPSAREMIPLANEQYKKNDTVDVAYFEPFYLKDFIVGK